MALSANSIYTLAPGRHHDGRGLYLAVAQTGRRTWLSRVRFKGRETTVKLGNVSAALGLAQARREHLKKLVSAQSGVDPTPIKRAPVSKTSEPDGRK